MFRMDRLFIFFCLFFWVKDQSIMFHTLQNLPTVSEGNKSTERKKEEKKNNEHKSPDESDDVP